MAITFPCTNPACGNVLTVADRLAGQTGNCPRCGEAVVVPRPAGQEAEVTESDTPATEPQKTIQFRAIGLGWAMLTARPWTWLFACLVVALWSVVAQSFVGVAMAFAMSLILATSVAAAGGFPGLTSPWFYLATLLPMAAGAAVQGVLLGGLFRMALRQLDGDTIRVFDVFRVGRCAGGMAVATVLLVLGWYVGLMALVVPGLVFMGLSTFVLPMVVDGPMGGLAAFRRSWGALRAQWLRATLFHCALGFILFSGVLLLGVGLCFTFPLYVLSIAAQYRRSFAPGGVRRPCRVENPYEDAIGVPRDEQTPAAVPVPAWLLMGLGMSSPVLAVAGLALLMSSMVDSLRQQPGRPGPGRNTNPPVARGGPARRPIRARIAAGPPPRFRNEAEAAAALRTDPAAKKDAYAYLLSRPIGAGSQRHEVTSALIPLLNTPDSVTSAERALLRWASADDVPALLETLQSPSDLTRQAAMRILGRVGDQRAAEPLASFLVDRKDRDCAARALRDLGGKSEGALSEYLSHPDPDVRSAAASVMGSTGTLTSDRRLTLAFSDLKSADAGLKLHGLDALQIFASRAPGQRAEVIQAIVEVLNDPREVVRSKAVDILSQVGGEEAAPHLIRALDDPDRFVRRRALQSLARRKAPEILEVVAARLDDPDLRETAMELLRRWRAEAVPAALKALQKPDPETRKAACELLRQIGRREALEPLRLATRDPDPAVASTARTALAAVERRTASRLDRSEDASKPPDQPDQ